jgi:hypothetical protein
MGTKPFMYSIYIAPKMSLPFHKRATVALAKNMTEPRKIPSLDIKLSGPSTYSEWVVSIETYLDLIPVDRTEEYRVWDIMMGIYTTSTSF